MRQYVKLALVLMLVLLIGGCGVTPKMGIQSVLDNGGFPSPNYNNQYLMRSTFWVFDNTAFYQQDGFYNMGFWVDVNGSKLKLFEEGEFYSDEFRASVNLFYVCKDSVYFDVNYYDRETHELSRAVLYCYDLTTYTYEAVHEVPYMFRWVIVGSYLIYSTFSNTGDMLAICDLNTGEEAVVCADVTEFGVVENEIRYITGNGPYELYRCSINGETVEKLGDFDRVYDEEYHYFNFTPDAVVMYNYKPKYDKELIVYFPNTDHTAVYTMPLPIQHMVACREYAFVMLCDSQDDYFGSGGGVYRVNLSDGSYEKVAYARDGYGIFASSDSEVYIITGISTRNRISIDP